MWYERDPPSPLIIHPRMFTWLWPGGIETTFPSFPSRWSGPRIKFWPMGFKERLCVQVPRRTLKEKHIFFSFPLAVMLPMTVLSDHMVSLGTTEQQTEGAGA